MSNARITGRGQLRAGGIVTLRAERPSRNVEKVCQRGVEIPLRLQ